MNFLMRIASLLGAETVSAGLCEAANTAYEAVFGVLKILLPIIFAIVSLVGVVYCIVLGVNYAKAEETKAREEAKKRLVGAIVGFGIAIAGSAIMWILAGTSLFYKIFV